MAFIPPPFFGTVFWAQRDGEQDDPTAPFLEIRPGELDATTTALRRIWKQFVDTTSWPLLFGQVLGPAFQDIELGMGSVDLARYLSTAEGRNLDEIGALIDRPRNGLSDDLYRLAIQADAGTLFKSGTIPEILEIVGALFGPQVELFEFFPATVIVQAPDISQEIMLLMLDVLVDATSAGVGFFLSTFDSVAGGGAPRSSDTTTIFYSRPAGVWGSSVGVAASAFPFMASAQLVGG